MVYLADQEVNDREELYAVPIEGGAVQKLNGPLPAGGDVWHAFEATPDGSQVVYVADEDTDDVFELYQVGIDGTARIRLTPGVSSFTQSLSILPDGSHAVWGALTQSSDAWGNSVVELRSVALGAGPLEVLASSLRSPEFLIPPDSSAVVYSDRYTGVHSVAPAGGPATSVAGPAIPGGRLAVSAISPDSATVLLRSVSETGGDLYAARLVPDTDADGDGLVFPCDCDPADGSVHAGAPEINDGQDNQCAGDPGHGQVDEVAEAVTVDPSGTFTWPTQQGATMYEVARAESPDFSVSCATWQTADPWWVDGDSPPVGGVYFYLVRALEPNAGSWGADSAGVERGPICPGGP